MIWFQGTHFVLCLINFQGTQHNTKVFLFWWVLKILIHWIDPLPQVKVDYAPFLRKCVGSTEADRWVPSMRWALIIQGILWGSWRFLDFMIYLGLGVTSCVDILTLDEIAWSFQKQMLDDGKSIDQICKAEPNVAWEGRFAQWNWRLREQSLTDVT